MSQQKEIAGAVLDTPEPDKWVDCCESRPLPMFHMSTLMQYGERCAEAAIAWLRSQAEPVAWMSDDGAIEESHKPWMDTELNPSWSPLFLAPQPAIPDGWQLVPKEPTPKMIDAAEAIDWGDADVRGSCCNQWQAMLASAPGPSK